MVAAASLSLPPEAAKAQAQESAVTEPGLNWVRLAGADDCISAAELADAVELRVGRTLFVATTEAELEQLQRCNRLVVSMLCHLISSGFNGRATISEESLNNAGSLHISHQRGGNLVLTVAGEESAAAQLVKLAVPVAARNFLLHSLQ